MPYALQQRPDLNLDQPTLDGGDAQKSPLAGMSYAEGANTLSPQSGQQQSGGSAVQLKKSKYSKDPEYVKKKKMPDEIKALNLKKVKVKLEEGQWEKLSFEEKQGVLTFLDLKEKEIEQQKKNKKNSRLSRIKKCFVTIEGKHVTSMNEEELNTLNEGAAANVDLLEQGEKPKNIPRKGKVIAVEPGPITVKETYTSTTEMIPGTESVTKEADFKSGSSTFLSAEVTQDEMLNSEGIQQLMAQVKAQIEAFLAEDPNAKITVISEGSESWVTPPPGKKKGDLAQLRAENGLKLVQGYLESIAELDLSSVGFSMINLCEKQPAGPKWDPTGLTKKEVQELKYDPMYTRWQYVNFRVTADMTVESDEEVPVTTTTKTQEVDAEADLVTMGVSEKKTKQKKNKKKNNKGKKFGYQANQKKTKKKDEDKGSFDFCPGSKKKMRKLKNNQKQYKKKSKY